MRHSAHPSEFPRAYSVKFRHLSCAPKAESALIVRYLRRIGAPFPRSVERTLWNQTFVRT